MHMWPESKDGISVSYAVNSKPPSSFNMLTSHHDRITFSVSLKYWWKSLTATEGRMATCHKAVAFAVTVNGYSMCLKLMGQCWSLLDHRCCCYIQKWWFSLTSLWSTLFSCQSLVSALFSWDFDWRGTKMRRVEANHAALCDGKGPWVYLCFKCNT